MTDIEIYTTPLCGYCHAAKRLLSAKGAAFAEIDVSRDPALRAAMVGRSGGRRTVPQIFIGGRHVGGCAGLYAPPRARRPGPPPAGENAGARRCVLMLERDGRLGPLLAG